MRVERTPQPVHASAPSSSSSSSSLVGSGGASAFSSTIARRGASPDSLSCPRRCQARGAPFLAATTTRQGAALHPQVEARGARRKLGNLWSYVARGWVVMLKYYTLCLYRPGLDPCLHTCVSTSRNPFQPTTTATRSVHAIPINNMCVTSRFEGKKHVM